jgi:ribonuclease P protein component
VRHLKKRADFVRLARRGRRWAARGLVLQVAPRPAEADGPGESGPRLGLTASRKVGGAVVRNRARRRLRALAELVIPDEGRPELDYVLIARAATADRPWAALQEDLRQALRRVGAQRT